MRKRSGSVMGQLGKGALAQIIQNMQAPMQELVEEKVKEMVPRDTLKVDMGDDDTDQAASGPSTAAPPEQSEAPQVDTGFAASSLDALNRLTGHAGKSPANEMDGGIPPTTQIWGATPKEEKAHNKVLQDGEKHKQAAVKRALQARMKKG